MNKYGLAARNNLEGRKNLIAKYQRVISQLSVAEVKPSQIQIRQSMQRVDPQGVVVRWLRLTLGRKYSVSGPLELWHIDGNHELIR